jgi:hypothetical protein
MKKSNSLLKTFLRRRLAIPVSPLEKYAKKPRSPRQPLSNGAYDFAERAGAGR